MSRGIVADTPEFAPALSRPLRRLRPGEVLAELEEIASYDEHRRAATVIPGRIAELTVRAVGPDAEFPLEDGENAVGHTPTR